MCKVKSQLFNHYDHDLSTKVNSDVIGNGKCVNRIGNKIVPSLDLTTKDIVTRDFFHGTFRLHCGFLKV